MVTFFIIYSIFLLAFSQAFFFLYKGSPSRASSKFGTYIDTWMGLFHMTLGDYDVSFEVVHYITEKYPPDSKICSSAFKTFD